ncbi:MAG: DNA-binding NtrC family response regulator [Myxococcota bacterium]
MGDLPLSLQSKLLRVLETSEVRPVGGSRTFRVDVRVISATHHNLKALVAEKRFREDLFYRLNVLRVAVPPLRERPDDITVLADHFLALQPGGVAFGPGVLKALIGYGWPGNVRQLENEVTRAALLADNARIEVSDLSPDVVRAKRAGAALDQGEAILGRLGLDQGTLKDRVDRLERHVLNAMLKVSAGNKSQVARDLGLSRAGLNMKLKRLDLWERA